MLSTKCVNLQSDYWTFGVLLWELFVLGDKMPYGELKTIDEVITYLNDGERLPKTKLAPTNMSVLREFA